MPLPKGYALDSGPKPPSGYTVDAPLAPTTDAPAAPKVPIGSLSAAPDRTWLQNAEDDVRLGGKRTLVGNALGRLQGSSKGYSGLGGVSPGAADFMASPVLGALHAAQGVQEIPQHPLGGLTKAALGGMEAATIPSMIAGVPEKAITGAAEMIPSAKNAGRVFESIMQDAKDVPVNMSKTMQPLEKTQRLTSAGAPPSGVADKLYQRLQTVNPLTYGEGRDFYTNVSSQSVADKLAQNGPMKSAMNELREAFKSDLGDAASTVGRGEDFANAMKEYASAQRLKDGLKMGAKWAGGAAGGGALIEGYQHLKRLL